MRGSFPTPEDAERRNEDCSRAIQSRELTPDELALAPLIRGSARMALGDKALRGDDYSDALRRYDSMFDSRNPDALNLFRRAAAEDALGNTDKALELYSEAIRLDPKSTLAFLGRGILLASRKRAYERAIEDLDKVLVLEPDNVLALTRAIVGQDLLRALADCDVALRLMPVNLDVRDTRGFIYLKLGDPALALNEYNAALEKDPNRATALFGRGLARIRSGDTRGSEGDQAAARTINPEIDQQFAVYGLN